jgi:hypothetical protein
MTRNLELRRQSRESTNVHEYYLKTAKRAEVKHCDKAIKG